MENQVTTDIQDVIANQKHLLFYQIMQYPIPRESSLFFFDSLAQGRNDSSDKFSWDQKNPYMDEYTRYIWKLARLYRSVPFVQSMYLCNSITFNALSKNSDIDIFIITKPWALRRARLWSVLLFSIFFLRRSPWNNKRKKFCLSFYVTQDHQNLYDIMLPQNDIYFIYWLAHLVTLYQETPENIYSHNTRLKWVLSNFPNHHCINIWTKVYHWKNRFKRFFEFLSGGVWWETIESLIKLVRLPIVIYKTKHLKNKWQWILISKNILKFHMDIRQKVHLLYMNAKKKFW